MNIAELLKQHLDTVEVCSFSGRQLPRQTLVIGDKTLSVQASKMHYSIPRSDTSPYTSVEVGYPNFLFSFEFIKKYAKDPLNPLDTIYPYVLVEDLIKELELATL